MCFDLTGIEISHLERQIRLLMSEMGSDDEEMDATNSGSPDLKKQVKLDELETKLAILQLKRKAGWLHLQTLESDNGSPQTVSSDRELNEVRNKLQQLEGRER